MHISVALKVVHILSVIAALGANATYLFWYSRAGRDPERLVWVIDSVRALDRRVANPAYLLALLSGAAMVLTGGFSFESLWIALSIALYILVALIAIALYAPAMRRQRVLALADPASPEYDAVARRARGLWALALVLVIAIVVLMVTKPTL